MVVVIIGHETTAAARRTSLFIVRAFVNDTTTVAVWTGFHLPLHSSPYHGNLRGVRGRARTYPNAAPFIRGGTSALATYRMPQTIAARNSIAAMLASHGAEIMWEESRTARRALGAV